MAKWVRKQGSTQFNGSIGEGAKSVPQSNAGSEKFISAQSDTSGSKPEFAALSMPPATPPPPPRLASILRQQFEVGGRFDDMVEMSREALIEDGFDEDSPDTEADAVAAALMVNNTLPFEVRRDKDGSVYVRNMVAYGPDAYVTVHPSIGVIVESWDGGDCTREVIEDKQLAKDMLAAYEEIFYDDFAQPVSDNS